MLTVLIGAADLPRPHEPRSGESQERARASDSYEGARHPSLIREFSSQFDPLALWREVLIVAPVLACFTGSAHLLQRDGEVEVRVRVVGIERQRFGVALL